MQRPVPPPAGSSTEIREPDEREKRLSWVTEDAKQHAHGVRTIGALGDSRGAGDSKRATAIIFRRRQTVAWRYLIFVWFTLATQGLFRIAKDQNKKTRRPNFIKITVFC
jgi:hypothetical protein